jgi:hypothetical protein
MRCERCGGLKVVDHFYGMSNDVPAWKYDGLRCINCGSITAFMQGERKVSSAPRRERSSRLGQLYAVMFAAKRTKPSELSTRLVHALASAPRTNECRRQGQA